MIRPKFKDKYHIEAVDGEGIFLLSERENFVLEGQSLFHIVPLIDGVRTVDEIISAVSMLRLLILLSFSRGEDGFNMDRYIYKV